MSQSVLLCAGGTGGHMFPAEALAHALAARGLAPHLVSDDRGRRYADTFPGTVHEVIFRPPSMRAPWQFVTRAPQAGKAWIAAKRIVRETRADAAVGFGGYPTLLPMLAARRSGCATLLHEQNAVLGRANRLLASRVDGVASGFPLVGASSEVTGNPVRPAVLEASEADYATPVAGGPLDLLVFGGSQGAQYFSQVVPEAMALLSDTHRQRIRLTLQAREDDQPAARTALEATGVAFEMAAFFSDMATRIARSHLVLSRAGASTVSELAVIGRPAILVPYPFALDHDQAANAAELLRGGGVEVVTQANLPAAALAERFRHHLDNPAALADKARAVRAAGHADAAERLADLVERTISRKRT
ncbi:UDP-N-acetylglucosamine--N-acetylmuramyl-(pentapeptide) pyrophosphoryl-undecaprenol N-acetylglucosamine transferase [Rhizobiaceae bacterium]|nr:UDP-N-acetylglucosamine--N-acetylmuramyl-(pentapeptide) pyrophosphoryl-undecaprenol N-acetylglucosamine transferase [Rhizobiaceae bacterium]